MTQILAPADWMTAAPTRAVITALEALGGPGCARFVGGAVRNSLMGRPVDDVDIATSLTPDQVTQALETAGLRAVPTGVEHGTVTAIADRKPFEITTLRRDVATDGRHAEVAFTDDWAADAQRRDFTFNALYADPSGQVFDPTGRGIADAREGRVEFVGDPATRLREDYLRVLRFFRFYAWYGQGEADPAALAACSAARDRLGDLSAERVSKELLKLLTAPDPRSTVELMARAGVLAAIAPEVIDFARFNTMVDIDGDPILRLAALLPSDGLAAEGLAARLRLSRAQTDRLADAVMVTRPLGADMEPADGRRAILGLGWTTFRDRLLLLQAAGGASPRALLDGLEGWTAPALPIRGADIAELGVPPGPTMGEVMRQFQAWFIEADFPTDRDLALAQLKAIVAAR